MSVDRGGWITLSIDVLDVVLVVELAIADFGSILLAVLTSLKGASENSLEVGQMPLPPRPPPTTLCIRPCTEDTPS
ncbi:MAG TPA: hypothetical protein VGR26_05645 [Acidimicrobiales bacterium]|nr:hypothetical protein [Acidimicrobiales bacterium]